MAELDVLTVRLEADVRPLQQGMDQARAQIGGFTRVAAPAGAATAKIGTSATQAVAGVGRLNETIAMMTRRLAGASPEVSRVAGALGGLGAIGLGVVVGLGAIALAFRKITEEARETKKAADEALKAVTNAWLAKQTQGDIDLINQQGAIGAQADAAARKLQRAKDTHENKEYLEKLQADYDKYQEGLTQATTLLADRRAERQREAAERAARGEKQAANDAASAWKKAYADIEAAVRLHHSTLIDMPSKGVNAGDFDLSAPILNVKPTNDAMEQLRSTTEKLNREFGLVPPPKEWVPQGGGDGRFFGSITSMLDPTMIASGLVTGFLSAGVNTLVSGLTKVGASLLGLSDAAEEAARRQHAAMTSLRDAITLASGSDAEKTFVNIRQQLEQNLSNAGINANFGGLTSGAEVLKRLREMRDFAATIPFNSGMVERFNEAIRLGEILFGDLNEQVRGLTDGLRNIPEGYKIALATFNATTPTPSASASRIVVHVVAEPEGIFRVVENQAVRKQRAGGTLEWEL